MNTKKKSFIPKYKTFNIWQHKPYGKTPNRKKNYTIKKKTIFQLKNCSVLCHMCFTKQKVISNIKKYMTLLKLLQLHHRKNRPMSKCPKLEIPKRLEKSKKHIQNILTHICQKLIKISFNFSENLLNQSVLRLLEK